MDELTVEFLTALAAGGLSFFFAYFPKVKEWFDALPSEYKPLINAGVLFLAAAGYLLVQCNFDNACVEANWQKVAVLWVQALIANQGAYLAFIKQNKQKAKALKLRMVLTPKGK